MEELKSYMIRLEKDGAMKSKIHPYNCKVRRLNQYPTIVITHNECTLFVKNNIQKA